MSEMGVVREATLDDLRALEALERKGFPVDQFTPEQLEYFLTEAHAATLVIEVQGAVRGSAIMLWRRASRVGHLYSITTDPAFQGRGLGGRLLAAGEEAALRRGCASVALEVRLDNDPALAMYRKRGYRPGRTVANYYEDGASALQMSRLLETRLPAAVHLGVPYHAQGLPFTSGPACLMMAMKHFSPETPLSRFLELALWKEAFSAFLTTGVGGCGPLGLAVAAKRRDYPSRVVTSRRGPPFHSSVRGHTRELPHGFHELLRQEARSLKVPAAFYQFQLEDVVGALREDRVPIVLANGLDGAGQRWVAITGLDARHLFLHDPTERAADRPRGHTPVPLGQFDSLLDAGGGLGRSLVLVGRPQVINTPG